MSQTLPVRRALLSVSDKTGIVEFARALVAQGAEILSTGGTAQAIRAAGVPVKDVSEHSGFPEILDGRVKTLVPQVHGGLLGRRDLPEHLAQMEAHAIAPIDLIAVNLYPFEATVGRGADFDDCIENIDIGGPAMIRSAAKNHAHVVVVTEPAHLGRVTAEIEASGGLIDFIAMKADGNAGKHEVFAEGFLDPDTGVYRGRPVDVAVMKDGSLLISDDFAGAIYRVSYSAP